MVAIMVLIVKEMAAVVFVEEAAEAQSISAALRICLINGHLECRTAVYCQTGLGMQTRQRSLCLRVLDLPAPWPVEVEGATN
jgi:hypothetical protein